MKFQAVLVLFASALALAAPVTNDKRILPGTESLGGLPGTVAGLATQVLPKEALAGVPGVAGLAGGAVSIFPNLYKLRVNGVDLRVSLSAIGYSNPMMMAPSTTAPETTQLPSTVEAENQSGTPDQMQDVEKLPQEAPEAVREEPTSIFKGLGILDRFLALWIFLAMAIGIILGNFVEDIGPALQKGALVGVSLPIGKFTV
ncbi:hypothetical protein FQN49_003750 [Arthroderma sp. PD_2]|nr:hypothetical protein FQN49_003750 [Arthroderma sp. PD_2]